MVFASDGVVLNWGTVMSWLLGTLDVNGDAGNLTLNIMQTDKMASCIDHEPENAPMSSLNDFSFCSA